MIEVTRGHLPVVLGLPHTGIDVPDKILNRLTPVGKALADTDWHIHRLYEGLLNGITTVRTPVHRYVIDVNRDPRGISLYPGQNTTGLCPLTDFDGNPLYLSGQSPSEDEVEDRRVTYHTPYHAALQTELDRLKAQHGHVILYDCHSIRSVIPYLFDGTLPDFNIGTNLGATCDGSIETLVTEQCRAATAYTSTVNGRFKGGWTTRHYGQPDTGQHAIQMELAQSTYMQQSPPWTYVPDRADALRMHLRSILKTLADWSPQ